MDTTTTETLPHVNGAPTDIPLTFETRSLPCELTEPEVAERSAELVRLTIEVAHLKEQKKAQALVFKSRMDLKQARINELLESTSTKRETRDVRCVERPEYRTGQVDLVRLDTHEVIETRAMDVEERQPELFTTSPSGDKVRKDTGEVVAKAPRTIDAEPANDDGDEAIDDPQGILDGGDFAS